jgi:hypothetical protein
VETNAILMTIDFPLDLVLHWFNIVRTRNKGQYQPHLANKGGVLLILSTNQSHVLTNFLST